MTFLRVIIVTLDGNRKQIKTRCLSQLSQKTPTQNKAKKPVYLTDLNYHKPTLPIWLKKPIRFFLWF